jgi:hypothetical protein
VKVLVACEFSGIVRDAFIARGHLAMSIDLLPTERPGPHYTGDVEMFLRHSGPWDSLHFFDLMIAHPPCTYLANSGVRWLYEDGERNEDRWWAMRESARFFRRLLELPIPRIAVENPVMHGHAKKIIGRGPDQCIQPYQFGHGETKRTCFWLKNLPPLEPTKIVPGREPRVHHASPGPDRWKERSRTLQGIADAMADQWGSLPLEQAA